MTNSKNCIYKHNSSDKYNKIQFEILEEVEGISIEWINNRCFLHVYLYNPQGFLCAQIVSVQKNGKRIIGKEFENCDPGCRPSESFCGIWTLEYRNYSEKKDLLLEIKINSEEIFPEGAEKFLLGRNFEESLENKDAGGKWLAGDLHTHTFYSDGQMSREENNQVAEMRGLNFYCPTDHNLFHYQWPETEQIIIPGIEITSDFGHVNLMFTNKTPFESHSIKELDIEEGFLRIINEAKSYALVSIVHPFMNPWEFTVGDFSLADLDFMEIINDPTYKTAQEAVEKTILAWNILLNDGYKVIGIGGSDSHIKLGSKYPYASEPSVLGDPRTYIYSQGKDIESLKNGLVNGNVSVSREGLIEFSSEESVSGDIVESKDINKFYVKISEEKYLDRNLDIHWILDGEIIKIDKSNEGALDLKLDSNFHWLRVDIRDDKGFLYGFSNPIFVNETPKTHKLKKWQDLLDCMIERGYL